MCRSPLAPRIGLCKIHAVLSYRLCAYLCDALCACAGCPNGGTFCIHRAWRCGHRPLRNSIVIQCVGADAYIGPPGLIQHLLLTVSLRSQCAHWLWQSASPVPTPPLPKGGWHGEAVTGGFFTSPHLLQPFRRGGVLPRPFFRAPCNGRGAMWASPPTKSCR